MNLLELLTGANVALGVLQARVVLVITLVLTFALFAWAMWLQSQAGIIIAAAWAVLVFLPVLYTGGRRGIEAEHHAASDEANQPARSSKIAA
jgi:high-affinity Fe2+/Pb2+ permease